MIGTGTPKNHSKTDRMEYSSRFIAERASR